MALGSLPCRVCGLFFSFSFAFCCCLAWIGLSLVVVVVVVDVFVVVEREVWCCLLGVSIAVDNLTMLSSLLLLLCVVSRCEFHSGAGFVDVSCCLL